MKKTIVIIICLLLAVCLAISATSAEEATEAVLIGAASESEDAAAADEEERDIFALPWDELTPQEQQRRAEVEAFEKDPGLREELAKEAENAKRDYETYKLNGSVTLSVIEKAVLSNNLTVLGIEENIAMIDEIDYDELLDDLRKAINTLSDAEWALMSLSGTPYADSYRLDQISSQSDTLNDQYDDIKSGKMQRDNDATVRMLRSTEKQLVMAAENLFMTQKGLELTDSGLERQLAALGRTGKELNLRYQKGQISRLALSEYENGVTQLKSGKETLEMNISLLSMQLRNLLGTDLGRALVLKEPSLPSGRLLAAMSLEDDLATAKKNSYQLYDARKSYLEAEKDWKDVRYDYGDKPDGDDYRRGEHQWKNAQYTYDATVNSFELSFRGLYYKVKDCEQIITAAQSAQATAEKQYQAAKLKAEYGQISQNELLKAADDLSEAKDKVKSAGYDLISAYNNYRHAVNDGIIN